MQRIITFDGVPIHISILGAPLEPLFEEFYANYFAGKPLPWDEISLAAGEYFNQNPTLSTAHDAYFNNFISLWRRMLETGRFIEAERIWELSLQPALKWEGETAGRRLHKGTPYYFWAMTVITRRDMDRGYLLIHKAVEEDIQTAGQPRPDTPGYAVVSLNHNKQDQAFKKWVELQAEHVEELIKNYNATHQRTLTLADLKQKFLTTPPTLDVLFLFTYTLARIMNISDAPAHVRTNPFAGQLGLNLLFDITLIIDATIKAKNPTQWQFINHAEHLLAATGHPLNNQRLGDINGLFNSAFDNTLQLALDATLILPTTPLDRFQCDVALAYGLRNNGAHNTGTAAPVWQRFTDVEQSLFRVFFATIDHLY